MFTERFPDHFTPYGRVTERLHQKLLKVALLMGGNPGETLCRTLSLEASSSTLIRLIHRQNVHPPQTVTVLGLDDWANKKRHTYGTCLVDLDRHKIIDLLPDRESITVEQWLKNHREVRIVTRNRFLNYIKGIGKGAPKTIQVADRWHLLNNLSTVLQKLLERNYRTLAKQRDKQVQAIKVVSLQKAKARAERGKPPTEYFMRREKQMKRIKEKHAQGVSIRRLSRELNLSRVTVNKYLHLEEPPRKTAIRTNIRLFDQYIKDRIKEDENIEIMQLWKAIKAMGFNGGRTAAYAYISPMLVRCPQTLPPKLAEIY